MQRSTEGSHPELQPQLPLDDIAVANVHSVLLRLSQRLSTLDGVEYEDHTVSDRTRVMKQTISEILRRWDNTLDQHRIQYIHTVFEELETIHANAVVVKRVTPGDGAELSDLVGPQHTSHEVPAENWASYALVRRRQKQMIGGKYRYDGEDGMFKVEVPCSYRCKKCLTNDHAEIECAEQQPTCLKCRRVGHVSGYCQWQLCAWCKQYGHGRQKCQSSLESPACLKCGKTGHDPIACPNSGRNNLYCRICRGPHSMFKCVDYERLGKPCFKHCGYHTFAQHAEVQMDVKALCVTFIDTNCFNGIESSYTVVQDFHFTLLRLCITETVLTPKIGNIQVCDEFFRRVYAIPNGRYMRLCNQVLMSLNRPVQHGNEGRIRQKESVFQRTATLVNILIEVAEPMPDGKGYILPSSMTKAIAKSLHFQKSNAFTKCNVCLTIRLGLLQNRFAPEYVQKAKKFLSEHLEHIKFEKQDYYVRMQHSRSSNSLLSIAHDGMSKDKTKWPHLLQDRPKKLTDTLKMMNSLNLGVVHKISNGTLGDQLHAFWNIDQMAGGTSNTIASQLFDILSNCHYIPPEISIQLDNCAANKNYNMLGAFGLLLLWVPKIQKVYLCMPQVGHTHDDVDRYFGILARVLQKKQVYSPFEMKSLPLYIKDKGKPEEFRNLLDRIKSRAVIIGTDSQEIQLTTEPEGEKLMDFLANPKIWKSWRPSEVELNEFADELELSTSPENPSEKGQKKVSQQPRKKRKACEISNKKSNAAAKTKRSKVQDNLPASQEQSTENVPKRRGRPPKKT
uniref:CCHC-type domain-containing protein n=1 Tax=Panagrolaimus superbus TaxID=310955 RepID=A0A914ZAQ0_9BILA